MEQNITVIQEKKTLNKRQKDAIFVACLVTLPLIHYAIFYVFANFNSILLAFQSYSDNGYYYFNNFANFERLFREFIQLGYLETALGNSLLYYVIHTVVGTAGSLFFAYYIYKKRFGSKFFKVVLFLPSIIASMALVLSYKYFVDFALPELGSMVGIHIPHLASEKTTQFGTVIVYGCMMGFGTSLLMYSGAMSNISDSVMEAAEIDGAGELRQFFRVALPLIYPTLTTFLINGVAGVLSSDMCLYAFYGNGAGTHLYTFGYYLLKLIRSAEGAMGEYPYPAAIGLILTFVTVPLTMLVRWALKKFGPSTV